MAQNITPNTISVGIAQADISPPVGTPSAGFAGRGPLTALHDPLYATALVLSDGKRSAALLACDLLYLNAADGHRDPQPGGSSERPSPQTT